MKLTATGGTKLNEEISRVLTVVPEMSDSFQHLGSLDLQAYLSQRDAEFSSEYLPLVLWFYYTK
jgi:hypothetical protein